MTTIELKKQERNIEVELTNKIHNDMTEKRYFVAELIRKSLNKYLDFDDMSADNSLSIYTLPIVNQELSVIDFEINSLSVHVVATVDKAKNQNVYIPQIYKQLHYKPDMFLFVNFSKTFTKMEILGYLTEINFQNTTISKESLLSADNLIDALQILKTQEKIAPTNIINTTNELMLAYIDNDLSDEGKRFFVKNLLENKEVRNNYKLFYSMNCNLISIAKTREIQKVNPAEEENKVDLQPRYPYLTAYESEDNNADVVVDDEIEESLLSSFEDTKSSAEEIQNEEENILEFSLQDLTTSKEESFEEVNNDIEMPPAAETIEEPEIIETEEQPQVTAENISTENTITDFEEQPQEETATNFEFSEDEHNNFEIEEQSDGDFELSLDGEDIIDLSQNNTEEAIPYIGDKNNIDEYSMVDETPNINIQESASEIQTGNYPNSEDVELGNNVEETSQNMELDPEVNEILNNSNIEEIENTDIELNDDELEAILNSDSDTNSNEVATPTYTDIQPPKNMPAQNNLEDISEDEDLFAFLSDISNEEETITPLQQETPVAPVQPEQISSQQIPIQNEPEQINNFEEPNIQNDIHPEAYTQQNLENIELNVNVQPQPLPKQKSSSSKLLLAFMLTIAVGAGLVYLNKDAIVSQLTKGDSAEDIQGLALDNNSELPPPVLDTNTGANKDDEANTNDAVAPAPAAVKNNQTTDNVPAAQNAPTLPNLPSTTVEPPKAKHMNDAIATALSKDFNGVRISKVSWEASETLVNNPDVKRYLTITGKSVKNTLSQDLVSATEPSFKDTVVVAITYRKDGSVSKIDIADSSGSAQIDGIIKKSVDNTLKFVKMPALNLSTPEYTAKLIIRL